MLDLFDLTCHCQLNKEHLVLLCSKTDATITQRAISINDEIVIPKAPDVIQIKDRKGPFHNLILDSRTATLAGDATVT